MKQVEYNSIVCTISILTNNQYESILKKLEDWLKGGIFTDVIFIAPGFWKEKNKEKLYELIKKRGHGWAWSRILFQKKSESDETFVIRTARSVSATHFIDANIKSNKLIKIVAENTSSVLGKVAIFKLRNKHISNCHNWLGKIYYYAPFEASKDAFNIIKTGVCC